LNRDFRDDGLPTTIPGGLRMHPPKRKNQDNAVVEPAEFRV